ncbi:MAG: hypothetical protein ABI318_23305 [Chthoniobacteraceae bacterium]
MKKILRSTVIAAASVASIFSIPDGKQEASRQKKQRTSNHPRGSATTPPAGGKVPPPPADEPGVDPAPALAATVTPPPCAEEPVEPEVITDRYPWRRDIVTTTFWIGEKPSKNNPTPNRSSSWDKAWASHYGGTDTPVRNERKDFHPADFVPGQNPFYVALPYNDMQKDGQKPEAKTIIPWFDEEYRGPTQSVCKGRWIAIRFKDRVAYAQWEDCGPFRTDHASYVFGKDRPKKNLNKGAGLDVSPAVRDFLGMNDTDVTDWKFVDFEEVSQGPWAKYGENNTFVINQRLNERRLAALAEEKPTPD